MPDPKDNAKLTGDTHQPDLDSPADDDAPAAEYTRTGHRPQGGGTKDKEARTSGSGGNTRDSGEKPA